MVVYAPAQIISAPAQLITAPAQPPATGAVVYTALFIIRLPQTVTQLLQNSMSSLYHLRDESFENKYVCIAPMKNLS